MVQTQPWRLWTYWNRAGEPVQNGTQRICMFTDWTLSCPKRRLIRWPYRSLQLRHFPGLRLFAPVRPEAYYRHWYLRPTRPNGETAYGTGAMLLVNSGDEGPGGNACSSRTWKGEHPASAVFERAATLASSPNSEFGLGYFILGCI